MLLPLLVAGSFKKYEAVADRVDEWVKYKKEHLTGDDEYEEFC